ncbi:hypothetical protein CMI37_27660 [Candidatus Pacearchaeota archaeon]|nr:hypothetical protein [Candidatus Pacearchaeota archaeon]
MNIHLENVNTDSNSGPNSFGRKLIKYVQRAGHTFDSNLAADVVLAFIESNKERHPAPLVQRLDGIYFNTSQNYKVQNYNIRKTYEKSSGVIFQSNFNRDLIFDFFGPHDNYAIIHNGADIEEIEGVDPIQLPDKFLEMWCCASFWRPHKRLDENIRYFLEHSPETACLVIAGIAPARVNHPRIFYIGEVSQEHLYSLYKSSKYCLHLAWLDHCPNVVVDARACGCKIICSFAGGTKEIAGPEAVVVGEDEWDFEPVRLYEPPEMDFSRKVKNEWDIDYNMETVAERYYQFLSTLIE